MEIILAKTAGYCIGVKTAVDKLYQQIEQGETNLVTYGPIIHNKHVTQDLAKRGVHAIESMESLNGIAGTVVIRTHGIPPKVYDYMEGNNISYKDYTCPFVKKIHRIVQNEYAKGRNIIIIGNAAHPEIIGINGFAKDTSITVQTLKQAQELQLEQDKNYSVVVQTTFHIENFEKIVEVLKNKAENIEIYNTICSATTERQIEAGELSKKVDKMIVIGDKSSANSNKLYEVCKENCENTYFIENIDEIELNIFETRDKIGITAGASTPAAVIKEAVTKMSKLENDTQQTFEEMLDSSLITLHTGDVVKGTVLQITNNEISVNLNYKSDGIVARDELSDDPNADPKEMFSVGDEIEVYVMKVNDGDGNVILSHKRIEEQKNVATIETAFKEKTVLKGKVVDVVKGGLMARINGVKVFVPSSQVSSRFVDDLHKFKGQDLDFHIIEFNRERRRMVAGRKELAQQEEQRKKQEAIAQLEVGMEVEGTISRMVGFGVFVDLGNIDGLIHITELSWNRNKKPSSLFNVGDHVKARVLKIDVEKLKISLSIKDMLGDPWNDAKEKYPIGSIVVGRVVRMVKFGAFVELESGVDGLIHISQISKNHVSRTEDILRIGQDVHVKIIDLDKENKKISLSKKEADAEMEAKESSQQEPDQLTEEKTEETQEGYNENKTDATEEVDKEDTTETEV
ncbi:MAG: bifunctional 4-hydroxy-3-methylbut-2-enyl diphosphate reductase/30S ribosomal protein S1 [Defluviitaleaceae bacterium]|nr:bifunctional 4-hydroxy-3-methylbut-2-enyl diphosphate reductase/30S ribosomal protein S1 [Defluviitaleaceae bacterium]